MKNLSKKILGIIIIAIITLYPNLILAETESELNSQKTENNQKIESRIVAMSFCEPRSWEL